MQEYILHLGQMSIGAGICMLLVPQGKIPALRTLLATVFLCMLLSPLLGDVQSFALPDLPQSSENAAQKEAEAWVRESYIENLIIEVKRYAGEEADVFITVNEDKTVDSVTVHHAEHIEGLRAFIIENLNPREVNIYGNEKDNA